MKWLCCSIFCTTLCGIILTASAVPIAVDTQAGAIQQSVKWLSWPWSCYTFGELAQQSIPPIYRQLIPVLQATFENPDVQPLETLDTRDLILKLRNHVDVFSLAYPAQVYGPEEKIAAKISETETVKEGSKVAETMNMTAVLVVTLGGKGEKDMFSEVRAQLDEGYETIGYFKDLGEDNITDPKMEANLRANCIKWYQGFMKQATEDDFEGYLAAPDTSNFHPHKEWSKFFWKSNPNTLPKSNDISGVAVLEQLVRIQFQDILEREQKVIGLAMILHVEAHEQFHDFRKSVRAIFDEVLSQIKCHETQSPYSLHQLVRCLYLVLGRGAVRVRRRAAKPNAREDSFPTKCTGLVFHFAVLQRAMCGTDMAGQNEMFGSLVFDSSSATDINVSYPPTRVRCKARY